MGERLTGENKSLNSKYGKKLPASTHEKLQMDNFALEEKVKGLESKLKDQTRKLSDLEESNKRQVGSTFESDRIKRNLENEITKLKDTIDSDKRKFEKLEKDLT